MKKLFLMALIGLNLAACKKEEIMVAYPLDTPLEVTRSEYLGKGFVQPLHIKAVIGQGVGWVHYELYDNNYKIAGKFYDTMVRPYRGKK